MNQDQEVPAGVGEFTRFVSRHFKICMYSRIVTKKIKKRRMCEQILVYAMMLWKFSIQTPLIYLRIGTYPTVCDFTYFWFLVFLMLYIENFTGNFWNGET